MSKKTRFDYGTYYNVIRNTVFHELRGDNQIKTFVTSGKVIKVVGMTPRSMTHSSFIEVEIPDGEVKTITQENFDRLIENGSITEKIEEIKLTGKKVPLRTSMQRKAYQELRRLVHECHPDDLKQFFEDHKKGLI